MAAATNMLAEELQASTVAQAHYWSVLEALSDALFVADLAGKVTTVNGAATRLLELPERAVRGRPIATWLGPEEAIERMIAGVRRDAERARSRSTSAAPTGPGSRCWPTPLRCGTSGGSTKGP